MSSSGPSARPTQVTVAGWTVAIASAFLLLSAFDALGSLHTVEVREQLTKAIDDGNLQGLGISVSEALTAKRWALYVSAVAAVLTGVLGVFVLQRDKAARIGLTIGAVPIVLTVPLTGSFLAMLVGAGAVVLWSRPARDWFAGRPITRPEPRPAARREDVPPPSAPPPAPWVPPVADPQQQPDAQPAPTPGWGAAPGTWDAPPPPYTAPPTYQNYPAYPPQQPLPPRPRQVRNACLVTWIFSGLTGLAYVVILAAIVIDQQALVDVIKDSPSWDESIDDDLIVAAAVAGSIIFLLWCVAASVIAVFTWRGAQWAWIVQLISTGLAALVTLLALPWGLIHLAAIGSAFGMLMSRPARDWFTKRRS